jgi:hypothetical protein
LCFALNIARDCNRLNSVCVDLLSVCVEQCDNGILHAEIGEVTIDDILTIYAAHGEGHIDQINRTLAAEQL